MPSQTFLDFACHVLKINGSYVSNVINNPGVFDAINGSHDSNEMKDSYVSNSSSSNSSISGSSWARFPIAVITITAYFLLIFWCVSFISKKSRKADLIGLILFCISSLGFCIDNAVELHGYNTLLKKYLSAACFLVFTISMFLRYRTSLETRVSSDLMQCLPVFALFIVIVHHFFPQTIVDTCNYDTLSKVAGKLLMIVFNLNLCLCSLGDLISLLNADQVNIMKEGKKIGYLVKKGTEWVEINPEGQLELCIT